MPSRKNIDQLEALKQKVERAKSIVLTKYSGLSVNEQNALRAEIKSAGGEYVVAKNTLVKIALNTKELDSELQDQTGVLISYEDEIGALKKLVEFSKKHEKPELKKGLIQQTVLSVQSLLKLASLPSKDALIAGIISQIQGPAHGLAYVLNAGMQNLVYTLFAVHKKRTTESRCI